MQKTRIEWVRNPDGTQGYVWNPIKGICPVGCWYCYGKSFYQRFRVGTVTPWLDHREFGYPKSRKSKGIFVCSTFELFHPMTKEIKTSNGKSWRDIIFYSIEHTPQHRFYILTKFPQNIDRAMPDNVWLGTSIDTEMNFHRAKDLYINGFSKVRFISFEPLLSTMAFTGFKHIGGEFDWIIVGKLTQHGKKYNPPKQWIEEIVNSCREFSIPVFLKDNLKEIWGEPLIQEFPNET